MATVVGVLDRDLWEANTDNIAIADPTTKTLTWIPRDLWCPSINHRINKAFARGGIAGLIAALRELGFPCDHGLVLRRSATERAAEGMSVAVPVEERLEFWYPLHPTQPIEDGRKAVSFWPPHEYLAGERVHQWVGARIGVAQDGVALKATDWHRMERQQVLLQALLKQRFDFAAVISDRHLVRISGEEAIGELALVDATWRMKTFTDVQGESIDGKSVLVKLGKLAAPDVNPHAPLLAVVVIALGAPEEAVDAVRSLLAQQPKVEIVVVNSGGGGMVRLLTRHGIDVPVIEIEETLYAGAARNIGIKATRAPYVAFLASDCRATEGWAMERLAAHRTGAEAVGSAVANSHPHSPFAWAGHLALWSQRMPGARTGRPYGTSYDRRLFDLHGLFREDLRTGEDSEFNGRLPPGSEPKWKPRVHTVHLNPTRLKHLIADQFQRGARAAKFQQECWGTKLPCGLGAWRRRTDRAMRASRIVDKRYRTYIWLARPLIPLAIGAYCIGARQWHRAHPAESGPPEPQVAASATARSTSPKQPVLTTHLFGNGWSPRALLGRPPRVIAIFSFRYDSHLVPDLIENLRPIVDGYVAYDDRGAREAYTDERERKALLRQAAREMGAQWLLCIDPDERLEMATAERIKTMTRVIEPVAWRFRLREMYTPTAYRVDGRWKKKGLTCLFPVLDGQAFSDAPLHGRRSPLNREYKKRDSGLNLYHLKMVGAERRKARRDFYKAIDPEGAFQAVGYDYLCDEAGLMLEEVPASRLYKPLYRETGAIWQPDLSTLGPLAVAVLGEESASTAQFVPAAANSAHISPGRA
ncbi:MAG: glycosyltransferase [Methyloceanibacter sp.]